MMKTTHRRRAGVCRVCGCTDGTPCFVGLGDTCRRAQPDLCSACRNEIADAIWLAWFGRPAPWKGADHERP